MRREKGMKGMYSNRKLKLLYLPNEDVVGDQVGPRHVFSCMQKEGVIADYKSYSFKYENKYKIHTEVLNELKKLIIEFQPDIILWQHVGDFLVNRQFLKEIRNIDSKPTLVYHDGDVYGRFQKRISNSMKLLLQNSDITFAVGKGNYEKLLRSYGAKHVFYSPNFVDTLRFGKSWTPSMKREYDVIMIGNNVHSKIPFFNMPGTKERTSIADMLYKVLGSKFAVYGVGWEGKAYNKGPIAFHEQEDVLRNSWISVGWNHFPKIPSYFSNRLPISLISGVVHVTNFHNGYDDQFPKDSIVTVENIYSCKEAILKLLEKDKSELINMGIRGSKLAREKFTADVVIRNIIQQTIDFREKSFKVET